MIEITALNAAGGLMVANVVKNFDEEYLQRVKTCQVTGLGINILIVQRYPPLFVTVYTIVTLRIDLASKSRECQLTACFLMDERPLSIQIRSSRKLAGNPSILLENEHETNLLS